MRRMSLRVWSPAQRSSGMIDPGFRSAVHSYQINPFMKYRGLEIFGVVERARGAAANEAGKRQFDQYAAAPPGNFQG